MARRLADGGRWQQREEKKMISYSWRFSRDRHLAKFIHLDTAKRCSSSDDFGPKKTFFGIQMEWREEWEKENIFCWGNLSARLVESDKSEECGGLTIASWWNGEKRWRWWSWREDWNLRWNWVKSWSLSRLVAGVDWIWVDLSKLFEGFWLNLLSCGESTEGKLISSLKYAESAARVLNSSAQMERAWLSWNFFRFFTSSLSSKKFSFLHLRNPRRILNDSNSIS